MVYIIIFIALLLISFAAELSFFLKKRQLKKLLCKSPWLSGKHANVVQGYTMDEVMGVWKDILAHHLSHPPEDLEKVTFHRNIFEKLQPIYLLIWIFSKLKKVLIDFRKR